MNYFRPTPLELGLLEFFRELYGAEGFPDPTEVTIVRRNNTGAGRYLDVRSDAHLKLEDGYYDLGGAYIELPEVPSGMMAVATVSSGHLAQIEIVTYGDHSWSGDENGWKIVKPVPPNNALERTREG